MKSWKAIMALLLCACMLFAMLAACAKQETPAPTNEPTSSNTEKDPEPAKTDDKQDEPAKTEEPEQQPEPEAPTEVIFWISDVYAHGADHLDRLTAAINAITEPNGVTVKPNFMNIGEWISKVQTSLISGEQVDLMCYSAGSGITSMVMRNMAMDITDELNEYAPETLDLMPTTWAPPPITDASMAFPPCAATSPTAISPSIRRCWTRPASPSLPRP